MTNRSNAAKRERARRIMEACAFAAVIAAVVLGFAFWLHAMSTEFDHATARRDARQDAANAECAKRYGTGYTNSRIGLCTRGNDIQPFA